MYNDLTTICVMKFNKKSIMADSYNMFFFNGIH